MLFRKGGFVFPARFGAGWAGSPQPAFQIVLWQSCPEAEVRAGSWVCSLLVLFVLRFLSCSRRSQTLRHSCCGRGWGGGLRSCAGCLPPDPTAWWVRAAPEVGCVCLGSAWPCRGHRQQRLHPQSCLTSPAARCLQPPRHRLSRARRDLRKVSIKKRHGRSICEVITRSRGWSCFHLGALC